MYSLSILFQSFSETIESFAKTKLWELKLTFCCMVLSLFLTTPAYHYLPIAMQGENWLAFRQKVESPISQPSFNDSSHAAKKTFRLTVPLIAKITHMGNWGVFLLQFFAGLAFIFFSIKLTKNITKDDVSSFFAGFGIVFIYAGHAGFSDINTWFDIFAYLFILLSLFSKNPFLIVLFIQLACWTDERGFFASFFACIFWMLQNSPKDEFEEHPILYPNKINAFAVVFSMLAYLISRYLLGYVTGLKTPTGGIGFTILLQQTEFYGMGIWTALEGFWIIFALMLFTLIRSKKYLLLVSVLFASTLSLIISFMVYDITRSSSYIFPLIFISIAILKQNYPISDLRKLLFLTAFVSFLFPAYYIITDVYPYVLWYKPFFVRIIDLARMKMVLG